VPEGLDAKRAKRPGQSGSASKHRAILKAQKVLPNWTARFHFIIARPWQPLPFCRASSRFRSAILFLKTQ
jgi:hypothetical protein